MTAPANLRGWGQGWPVNRQKDMRLVQARFSGARWWVHHEIAPIVQHVVDEVERRGYLFDYGPEDTDDDWGYANRPIRGKRSPSNHSWGLAIDVDAQNFPMGQSARRPPQWIVDLFDLYGFDWGGTWSRPDPMHFEYRDWPSNARWTVGALAAAHVGGVQPAIPKNAEPPAFVLPEEEPDMDWLIKIDDGRAEGNGIWYRDASGTYWIDGETHTTIAGGYALSRSPLMKLDNPPEKLLNQLGFR